MPAMHRQHLVNTLWISAALDCASSVISFNAASSTCEKVGQWQRVAPLFVAMRMERLTPDVTSFSAAISACEKGGQWYKSQLLANTVWAHAARSYDIFGHASH
eukprot:8207543-Karenia_brevis.AAC.1